MVIVVVVLLLFVAWLCEDIVRLLISFRMW